MSYMDDRLKRKNGILPPLPTKKEKKALNKVSPKKQKEIAQLKNSGDDKLDLWFEEIRGEMKGKCVLCGGETEKKNDETYRRSIHHLLDKRPIMFPSIATHEDNWLEVCFYGNSCHTNIHNGTITWELLKDSKEWDIVVGKFKKIYPFISPSEHKNIPEILLNELK
jgi:hypothetical protein